MQKGSFDVWDVNTHEINRYVVFMLSKLKWAKELWNGIVVTTWVNHVSIVTLTLEDKLSLETLDRILHVSALAFLLGCQQRRQCSLGTVWIANLSLSSSLTDDLEQVWLNNECGDFWFLLLRFLANLTNLSHSSLEERRVQLVDDGEEPVTWNELLRLIVVWQVLAYIRHLVDFVKNILDGEALQLINVHVWYLIVEEERFLTGENHLQEWHWAWTLGWKE